MTSIVRFAPSRTLSMRTAIRPASFLGGTRLYRHAALVDPLVPFRGSNHRDAFISANPFAMLNEMQNVMKSLDRDLFREASKYSTPSRAFRLREEGEGPLGALQSTLGCVDVHETDQQYIISVDCPGVTHDDVKLIVKEQDGGHVLTISGERKTFKTSSSSKDTTTHKPAIATTAAEEKGTSTSETTLSDAATDTSLSPESNSSSSRSTSSSSLSSSNDTTWHLQERSIGTFERHFWLPQNLNVDSSAAEFSNGVLTVSFEKQSANHTPTEKMIKITKKE